MHSKNKPRLRVDLSKAPLIEATQVEFIYLAVFIMLDPVRPSGEPCWLMIGIVWDCTIAG